MFNSQLWFDSNRILLLKPKLKRIRFRFRKIKKTIIQRSVYYQIDNLHKKGLTRIELPYGECPFMEYEGYYLRQKKTIFKNFENRSYTITLNKLNNEKHVKQFKPIIINDVLYKKNIQTGLIESYSKEEIMRSFSNSRKRSFKTFDEIAQANADKWQFFGTLTFDKEKINRYDDAIVYSAYKKYIDNLKHQFPNLIYLTVIERHKKQRAIHFHILFGNTNMEELGLIDSGHVVKSGKNVGQVIYNTTKFKFGFTTFTKILNAEATINYCKKYLSKSFMTNTDKFKKRFFYSKNCERPIVESKLLNFLSFDADEAIRNFKNVVDIVDVTNDYTYLPNRQFCVKKEIYK